MIFQLRFQAILMFWLIESILCNCSIEADNHRLLNDCFMRQKEYQIDNVFYYQPSIHKLPGYASKLAEPLTLIRDRTHYEQPLPIHLNIRHYDNPLNNRPSKLKEFLIIIYKIQMIKKF